MRTPKIAIGYIPSQDAKREEERLEELLRYKDRIYDLHFAHYDPTICSSGRYVASDKHTLLGFIEMASQKDINLSLLLNYSIDKDYKKIIRNFGEEFYTRGIRSVVIADLELIKYMKQTFPDVHIQGSCLSYRMTEDDLYEEAKEGVELHNPAVDIIRDYKQLIANSKAGFKQKVIFGEGCMHKCPFERIYKGHRWHISRNLAWKSNDNCKIRIKKDFRVFCRANWVTIDRLRELSDYIEVIKLPRKNTNFVGADKIEYPIIDKTNVLGLYSITNFFDTYDKNLPHNVLDYIGVMYYKSLRHEYKKVPSSYFSSEFFKKIAYCHMECKKNNCDLCYRIEKRLIENYRREHE